MAITYHAGRRIQGLSTEVLDTVTFEDDFTSYADTTAGDLAWKTDNTGKVRVNPTTDVLDWDGSNNASSTSQTCSHDLGITINETQWVLRFKMTLNNFTGGTQAQASKFLVGISDLPYTTNNTSARDFIGFCITTGNGYNFYNAVSGIGAVPVNLAAFATAPSATTIYVEIIRTGSTTFTTELFSDSSYSTSIEQQDGNAISSSLNGLRYLLITNQAGQITSNGINNGTMDDFQFYNGVSSLTSKPTNVQVGSRFEETDTRKMYHKESMSLTGLKAYYKFNEASGDIINQASAVGSTDMIATSDLVVSGATYGVTGKIGDALSFDGTNDSASASSTSTSDWSFLSQSGVAFTIIFWYKADDFVANRSFFATSNFGTDGINIVSKTDRYIRFLCGNTSAGFMDFTTTTVIQPNDTNWHMLMAKYDDASGVGTLSIDNGIVETKGSQNLTNTSSPNYVFKVAQDGLGAGYYKGDIDEFSIWNRILTTAEITSLYNSGSGIAVNDDVWKEEGT